MRVNFSDGVLFRIIGIYFYFDAIYRPGCGQTLREFPRLENAALSKPVVTSPVQSSCGIPTRTTFCESTELADSVANCKPQYCIQKCPVRTNLPPFVSVLSDSADKTLPSCAIRDTTNVRPNSISGSYSVSFLSNKKTACPLSTSSTISLAEKGAFTLSLWIWLADSTKTGTLIEKTTNSGEIIFSVSISETTVDLRYRSTDGEKVAAVLNENISPQIWNYLAIQVYESEVSVFLNGLRPGFAATETTKLSGPISDGTGETIISYNKKGNQQFFGRLQDFKFFSKTLSNREIGELYTGVFPVVSLQSDCRCPATHPRVKPQSSRYCIKNSDTDTTDNEVIRLDQYAHPLGYLNDGDSSTFWVSSHVLNEVSITVDLQDQFQWHKPWSNKISNVYKEFNSFSWINKISASPEDRPFSLMAGHPLAQSVIIEKLKDKTASWTKLQYYATDCMKEFNLPNNGPLSTTTAVNCIQIGSSYLPKPLSHGNITFNVLSQSPAARPGYLDFYNTPDLSEFVLAEKIRITLKGHLSVTETSHMYYGLFQYIVSARCNCNGHAKTCDTSTHPYKCQCLKESNTEGLRCDSCKLLFNDKPFRQGTPDKAYDCKACQCNNHASSCTYDAGIDTNKESHDAGSGGVCNNCQHNTTGRFCDSCIEMFYRRFGVSLDLIDVCLPCNCHAPGVDGNIIDCEKIGGQCLCKQNVGQRQCEKCRDGFYNLKADNALGCEACGCHAPGTVGSDLNCHQTSGHCNCKANVRNQRCDRCQYEYYNLTALNPDGCSSCECNPLGSLNRNCDPENGQCVCKNEKISGRQCDQCADGFHNFKDGCLTCDCENGGSEDNICNKDTGKCRCKKNVEGQKCNICVDTFFNLKQSDVYGCEPCGCYANGTKNESLVCDKASGTCSCKDNVQGRTCNQCKGNTWGLGLNQTVGCLPCDCDPSGTVQGGEVTPHELACDQNSGQCTCLVKRIGRRCDSCELNNYVLTGAGMGCQPCNCGLVGVHSNVPCDPKTGQCSCETGAGLTGRRCDSCLPRYYGYSLGQCTLCDCGNAGSFNDTCHQTSGQCFCKEYVTGKKCKTCKTGSSNLDANNPYGCSKVPDQQPPPTYKHVSPTELEISWGPPDNKNGVITKYVLARDDKDVFTSSTKSSEPEKIVRSYLDQGLQPFTLYRYTVTAFNDFGKVSSPVMFIQTLPGKPSGIFVLNITRIAQTYVSLDWMPPSKPNGYISGYFLSVLEYGLENVTEVWSGNETSTIITELASFTNYTFTLKVCTAGGCFSSSPVWAVTLGSAPTGQMAPNVSAFNSTTLYITWKPPKEPNGIIIFYELWMKESLTGTAELIFHPAGQYNPRPVTNPDENALPPPATDYSVIDLKPFTQYHFQVLSQNDNGRAASPWVTGRTGEAAPVIMPSPNTSPISSSVIQITWTSPSEIQSNGIILTYKLYEYVPNDKKLDPFGKDILESLLITIPAPGNKYDAEGYLPYSVHRYKIDACNSVGCVSSSDFTGRTLPSAPSGLVQPLASGYNYSTMQITWKPPAILNGPSPNYTVDRMEIPFSSPPPAVVRGTRFTGGGYYKFPHTVLPFDVSFTAIRLRFRTSVTSGLLFFAATEQQDEYVAIQIIDNRIWFVFNPQGCVTFISTTDDEGLPYGDNYWHSLYALRRGKYGILRLDDKWTGEKTLSCTTGNLIGGSTAVYIGGIPDNMSPPREGTDKRAWITDKSFHGCVKDVQVLQQESPVQSWKTLDWNAALDRRQAMASWEGCPSLFNAQATHFLGTGYIVLNSKSGLVEIPSKLEEMTVKIRTTLHSSFIFLIHSANDRYIYLQIKQGAVQFVVRGMDTQKLDSNSKLVTRELIWDHTDVNVCDGFWHTIKIMKLRAQLQLSVDDKYPISEGDYRAYLRLDILSHQYVGGIDENDKAIQAYLDKYNLKDKIMPPFGGCIDAQKDMKLFNFNYIKIIQDVNLDGCPLEKNFIPGKSCISSVKVQISTSTENTTYDFGLPAFSAYNYRVIASNTGGQVTSPWTSGRTKEGAPTGVSAPTSVISVTGYVIDVKWGPPAIHGGLLSQYILRAYNKDLPSVAPIEKKYTNVDLTAGNMTNVIPFTNYSIKVVACTNGGCTESTDGKDVVTKSEAPEDVPAPTAQVGPTQVEVTWNPPGKPNGVLTGYLLYMDDVQVYAGALLTKVIKNLQVYTTYRFYVRACTAEGCTNSLTSSISTSQLPPGNVDAPKLQVLGTKQIRVDWKAPAKVNGVLERYLIFASTVESENGKVLYNSTDVAFIYYELDKLIAGTQYFIRVAACTGGGCTASDSSSATTEESAPEGVHAPDATSSNPKQIVVSWSAPEYPNGEIIKYELYQNNKLIKSGLEKEHTIGSLEPWSLQLLYVKACTKIGCGTSPTTSARTEEAPPSGVVTLYASVNDPRSVSATWNAPAIANGQLRYNLTFAGIFYKDIQAWDYSLLFETRVLSNTDVPGTKLIIQGLIPLSQYKIQVVAYNSKGEILSDTETVQMPPGTPDGVLSPNLVSNSPTAVRATWRKVGRSNSVDSPLFQLQFKQKDTTDSVINLFDQPTTSNSYVKDNLEPYTEYEFRLGALNSIGTTWSLWKSIFTNQDKPQIIDPPHIKDIKQRGLTLYWVKPSSPNGILNRYKIYQNDVLYDELPSNVTSSLLTKLTPYTEYVYKVEACTDGGCTMSQNSDQIRTLSAAPTSIQAPSVSSQTPTTVTISWIAPKNPNGIITGYIIQRRLLASNETVDIRQVKPEQAFSYVDQGSPLQPYTAYQYRLSVSTGAGTGYGPWADIITRPSRPAGLKSPEVKVLSPRSLHVSWEVPTMPNGKIEFYVIKMPKPQIEVRNESQTQLTVNDLVPFTTYVISLVACTSGGGCTESTKTVVRTSGAAPEGQPAPTVTPISQDYISVFWQSPSSPNGPNIRYELSRLKVAEPLETNVIDLGTWKTINTGTQLSFEDRSLKKLTTNQYRITVYNDFGFLISPPSVNVTTFGGQPIEAPMLSAAVLNHISVRLNWSIPDVSKLQGYPVKFNIETTSVKINSSNSYAGDVREAVISDLQPNTLYYFRITVTVNGGMSISGSWESVTTLDGAPVGISPPILRVLGERSMRITWSKPSMPNGLIRDYNIYIDNQKIETNSSLPGSITVDTLRPYTVYNVKLEVCTVYSCVQSNATQGVTLEAIALEISQPKIFVLNSSAISIEWKKPGKPNGIIKHYEIHRKTKINCSDRPKPMQSLESKKCTYIECGALESLCGSTCFSGKKTCCNGKLYDNKLGYECCNSDYVPLKSSTDDVCCGGKFYKKMPNYICCNKRYVNVNPGEICCPDAVQDRVDIGFGNACCGSIPFDEGGAQMCCSGKLHGSYQKKCCGKTIVNNDQVCCGNSDKGTAYSLNSDSECCGDKYTPKNTSICCINGVDDVKNAKVYRYDSIVALQKDNRKCCGTSLVSNGLSCCVSVGYNSDLQVCADRKGCGSGTICPISQSSQAQCDRCDFNPSVNSCGQIAGDYVPGPPVKPTEAPSTCHLGPELIYKGMQFKYTDLSLNPFTTYEYVLVVVNGAGSGMSDYSSKTTAQTAPIGVSAPVAEIRSNQYDVIYLSWKQPAQPNGEISRYILLRDGLEIYRGIGTSYKDDNTIQPYKIYTYELSACTVECTKSTKITVATLEAPPGGVSAPTVSDITSQSLKLTWTIPTSPNGLIKLYKIIQLKSGIIYNGPELEVNIKGLEPYISYEFFLEACSAAGCTRSQSRIVTTSEALPSGLGVPKIIIINSISLEVVWNSPKQVNGKIIQYNIYQKTKSDGSVTTKSTKEFKMLYENQKPGQQYEYVVEVVNGAGGTNSTSVIVTMPAVTPEGIAEPKKVTVLDAYSLYVEWDPPSKPNGNIDQYVVLLNGGSDQEIKVNSGKDLTATVKNLKPYTNYNVRIQSCLENNNGCGTGPGVNVITHEAPPLLQSPPALIARSATVIDITWDPPEQPNGKITEYLINRRQFGDAIKLTVNTVTGDSPLSYRNADVTMLSFTEYEYQVVVHNSKGSASSAWVKIRTPQTPPQDVSAPLIISKSAYGIKVKWNVPSKPNGIIIIYKIQMQELVLDLTLVLPIIDFIVPSTVSATSVSGLKPFTAYQSRLVAVNSVGEGQSVWIQTKTAEAAPSDVAEFIVTKHSSGVSLNLKWPIPGKENGNIKQYKIYEEGSVTPIYTGINREFEYRRLTPFTKYTIQLEACNSLTGDLCGRGKWQKLTTAEVLPSNPAKATVGEVNAIHVVITWNRPSKLNGKIVRYNVYRKSSLVSSRKKRESSNPLKVHTITNPTKESYQFTDTTVKPFTKYGYQIMSCNSIGCSSSAWQNVETPEAPPADVISPSVRYVNGEPDKLSIEWDAPTQPNGIIQDYKLQRNDSIPLSFGTKGAKIYVDKDLVAYSWYSYTITVCTGGGCTTSSPTIKRTMETPPLLVTPPLVSALSPTSLKSSWQKPQITNGEIIAYHLYMDGVNVYSGLTLEFTSTDLIAYQSYLFVLSACTNGGCKNSTSVNARPDEAPPQQMRKPTLQVMSSVAIEITWQEPLLPNGVIISYEVRRDGTIVQKTNSFTYVDYGLLPGKSYSYTVTVKNSKGNSRSPVSSATTYSSSPEGLLPPKLVAVSSESIKATWSEPSLPNGVIVNYTLYADNKAMYTGKKLSYTVHGLAYYSVVNFRVQACTLAGCSMSGFAKARTGEAPPSDVLKPSLIPLENINGMHDGVRIQWRQPDNPNGNITYYEIYRRERNKDNPSIYGPELKVYYGLPSNLQYEDKDSVLKPFTEYQYRIVAFNKAGQRSSEWQEVTTQEAPPARVDKPTILEITSSSVKVEIPVPDQPNGEIQTYEIVVNGLGLAKSKTTTVSAEQLEPFRNYTIQARVCTSVGCTNSKPFLVQTKSAKPEGLAPPIILRTTSRSMLVSWSSPSKRNGIISSYELSYRMGCVKTSTGACTHGSTQVAFRGLSLKHNVTVLKPYKLYSFRVQAFNEEGASDTTEWSNETTKSSAPVVLKPPVMTTNGSRVIVIWDGCFLLNGELLEYILYTDGVMTTSVTSPTILQASVERSTRNQRFKFYVRCRTREGVVDTSTVIFDPNAPGNVGLSTESPQPVTRRMPFYQEVWFIVCVLVVALLLLFIGVVFCIKHSGRSTPFIRERAPLQPRQMNGSLKPGYIYDPYNGSIKTLDPASRPGSQASMVNDGTLHAGFVNPAFATIRSNSINDLTFDRHSQKSMKYASDNDEGDPAWDTQFEDDDYQPKRSYNLFTKEQLFTDTHL